MSKQQIKCGKCGKILPVDSGEPEDQRQPCPKCGSKSRAFEVVLSDEVQLREKIRVREIDPSLPKDKKVRVEQVSGSDFHRKTGKWNNIKSVIDKRNNRYSKEITDSAGKVIRHCDEPLKDHKGYGSAKKKKDKPQQDKPEA